MLCTARRNVHIMHYKEKFVYFVILVLLSADLSGGMCNRTGVEGGDGQTDDGAYHMVDMAVVKMMQGDVEGAYRFFEGQLRALSDTDGWIEVVASRVLAAHTEERARAGAHSMTAALAGGALGGLLTRVAALLASWKGLRGAEDAETGLLELATGASPDDDAVWHALGVVRERAGAADQAVLCYQTAESLNPAHQGYADDHRRVRNSFRTARAAVASPTVHIVCGAPRAEEMCALFCALKGARIATVAICARGCTCAGDAVRVEGTDAGFENSTSVLDIGNMQGGDLIVVDDTSPLPPHMRVRFPSCSP